MQMSPINLVNTVREYLASHHMLVDEDWLEECIEHFSTSNNCSEIEIKKLVEEQWLLNDLKIVCPGSLPANLRSQQKMVLQEKFVVQINSVIDIGTPAYQQYLKLKKVNMENVEATSNSEEKISSHRMLKLEITDGVQDLSAVEYRPMRNLSSDIKPGIKILIKGPVECRRGMLLLTENVVELLGGEAEELFQTNSLAGLLHAKFSINEDLEYINTNQIRNRNIQTPYIQLPSSVNHTQQQPPHPTNHTPESILEPTEVTVHQPSNFADDEIDIEQIAELEAQLIENPGKRPLNHDTTNDSNPEKKVKIDLNVEDFPNEDDLLFEEEDTDYMRVIDAELDAKENELLATPINSGPHCVPSDPFVYIKQFNELNESERVGKVFKIKGQVMTLLSKLSVSKEEWSLKCTVVDGTGRLDVDFTSDVLSKLVGITPQEMIVMKKQVKNKVDLEMKLKLALQNARDKLQVMYCIIEISVMDTPKITNFEPYESVHVEQLKRRVPN